MGISIVTVNVTETQAPAPNNLQQVGAAVSQGATNTAPGTLTLLTQPSSLTPIINGANPVSGITQTAGTATLTATNAHDIAVGDSAEIVVAGATPAAYNGTFLATATSTHAVTYAVPSGTSSPASGTIVYTLEDVGELVAMVTTFFAQGSVTPLYVFECGVGDPNDGVAFLQAWITANPLTVYAWLVPRTWDGNDNFIAMLGLYNATTALVYFWITTTLATYQNYTNLMKCARTVIEAPVYGTWTANALTAISYSGGVVTATTASVHGVAVGQWFQISGVTPTGYNGWWQAQVGTTGSTLVYDSPVALAGESALGTLVASYVSSPGIPATEFSMAAFFYVQLSYRPSSAFRVPPYAFSFLYGVTPFPNQGNSALLTTLRANFVNYVATGAEGGISNTMAVWGVGEDGTPLNFWWQIDWLNININLDISNAVINGSNNTQNPLYADQDGVDQLQAVGASTISSGITFGLIFGQVLLTSLDGPTFAQNSGMGLYDGYAVINAVPFATYYAASPSDYSPPGGGGAKYAGFSVSFSPQNGFTNIVFNLNATEFVG